MLPAELILAILQNKIYVIPAIMWMLLRKYISFYNGQSVNFTSIWGLVGC